MVGHSCNAITTLTRLKWKDFYGFKANLGIKPFPQKMQKKCEGEAKLGGHAEVLAQFVIHGFRG